MSEKTSFMLVTLPLLAYAAGGWDLAFIGAFCAVVLYFSLRAMASQHLRLHIIGWCTGVGGIGGAIFGGGVEYGVLGLIVAQLLLWLSAQVLWHLREDGTGRGRA